MENILSIQRKYFSENSTMPYEFRINQLRKLLISIEKYKTNLIEALNQDLGKAPFESYLSEINMVIGEIKFAQKNLRKWMTPIKVASDITHYPSEGFIYKEPKGVVLILSAWNYPVQLSMVPLVAAIASGNCVMLKVSELAVNTAIIIENLIAETFDEMYIKVFRGGVDEAKQLCTLKFDHIFFTGSVDVGRSVMMSAAKNLVPVTLELGGKNPCIIDETANLKIAARRYLWSKAINSGQSCVAPDYLCIHKSVKLEFLKRLREAYTSFWGDSAINSADYSKVINVDKFERLRKMINKGNVVFGGNYCKQTLKIEPTIIDRVDFDSSIMKEEIFGPISPLIEYDSLEDLIYTIKANLPKSLAAYLYSCSEKNKKTFLQTLSFGGGCINDGIMHITGTNMPFGGVGDSGMGNYHGKFGFDTFSHQKPILDRKLWLDPSIRYAPYKDKLKYFT